MKASDDDSGIPLLVSFVQWAVFVVGIAAALWIASAGLSAVATGHLDRTFGIRPSGPAFPVPLYGVSAVLAGVSFLFLAASLISICLCHPRIVVRLPSWVPASRWWLFGAWTLCFFVAHFTIKA